VRAQVVIDSLRVRTKRDLAGGEASRASKWESWASTMGDQDWMVC
jgi:hypothetical protein